jgi:hypothetical protein
MEGHFLTSSTSSMDLVRMWLGYQIIDDFVIESKGILPEHSRRKRPHVS